MGSNKPLLVVFIVLSWQIVLDVLQIVVRREIQIIAGGDHVIQQLRVIVIDHTKALIRVKLLASLYVNEVLLDVGLLGFQLLLLFKLLLVLFVITHHPRFHSGQICKRQLPLQYFFVLHSFYASHVRVFGQNFVNCANRLPTIALLLAEPLSIWATRISELDLPPICLGRSLLRAKATLCVTSQRSSLLGCIRGTLTRNS